MAMRVGFGTDVHRLRDGDGVRLGGILIPCPRAAEAVSDGDVLLHALVDALLGAAGLGDIGDRYPESKVRRGEDSRRFVEEVMADIAAAGGKPVNVDCVVHLESPKLGARKPAIRDAIAAMLEIDVSRVNVKAKTAEGLDAIGKGEAVAAQAIVLLEMPDRNAAGETA